MKYSIDTSAILDGWRRYYPPDRFPSVWRNIEQLIASRGLCGTEEVLSELKKKDDDVYRRARNQAGLFLPIDGGDSEICCEDPLGIPEAGGREKESLDSRPVRDRGSSDQRFVATREVPSNNLLKPKIPDVCTAMGIRHVRLLELFGLERWRF